MYKMSFVLCFHSEAEDVFSGAFAREKQYNFSYWFCCFLSLSCSRNDVYNRGECGCVGAYERGALSSLEWEVLVSESTSSGKIDFCLPQMSRKSKTKPALHSKSPNLSDFHANKPRKKDK